MGGGGNIEVDAALGLLERSEIRANAFEGRGGNIAIRMDGFIPDRTSEVTASSERDVDGEIEIQSLTDPSSLLSVIDQRFASDASLQNDLCQRRLREGHAISRFRVVGRDRVTIGPHDLLTSPLREADINVEQRGRDRQPLRQFAFHDEVKRGSPCQ